MRILNLVSLLAVLLVLPAARADLVSFSNAAYIAIPGSGTTGTASPYPSVINVSGMAGTITDLDVTLFNLSHTFPGDIDILLVAPGGALTAVLMSDAGSAWGLVSVTLTFDDVAASFLPNGSQIVAGSYKPTNYEGGEAFPSPALGGPYGAALSAFNGIDPNGDWSLYVVDDADFDLGSMAGGWSMTVTTDGAEIPEPSTLALLCAGLGGLFLMSRRSRT